MLWERGNHDYERQYAYGYLPSKRREEAITIALVAAKRMSDMNIGTASMFFDLSNAFCCPEFEDLCSYTDNCFDGIPGNPPDETANPIEAGIPGVPPDVTELGHESKMYREVIENSFFQLEPKYPGEQAKVFKMSDGVRMGAKYAGQWFLTCLLYTSQSPPDKA